MGWENKIIGYNVTKYSDVDGSFRIPTDAEFLSISVDYVHTYGSKHFGFAPRKINVYHFKTPIYKKIRTKKHETKRNKSAANASRR